MDDSDRQIELADEDRCTYAVNGKRCPAARSYFFRDLDEGAYCHGHALPSHRADDFEALPEADRQYWDERDFDFMKGWRRSREGHASAMLTNDWKWTSSEEWCEVFGCCGRGWAVEEDEQAYGELRAAHLLARLPIPDWISNPGDYPPRRRSAEAVIAELRAEVALLRSVTKSETVAPFA